MARKPRDYRAEYEARNRRSQARYGVNYGKQRRLVEKGQKAGLKPTQVRKTLASFKAKTKPGDILDRLISRKGDTTEWDPFAPCINVRKDGDLCGHLPAEHKIKKPHPCTICTCPEYIHPDGVDEYPEHLFYYK